MNWMKLRFLNQLLNQKFNLGLLTTLNPEMQECTTLIAESSCMCVLMEMDGNPSHNSTCGY